MHRPTCTALLFLLAAAACDGDDDGTRPPSGPALTILAGANATDTVGARLAQALTIEVRDEDGRLRPGTIVRFEPLPASSEPLAPPSVHVAALTSQQYGSFVADTTDAKGRVHALVEFGTIAGPAGVLVSVPEFAIQDTAHYTVLPGALAGVQSFPEDTVLSLDAAFQLRSSAVDRFGNARDDPLAYTEIDGVIEVAPSGRVTARQAGRGGVIVSAQEFRDTTWVTVVPGGKIAAATQTGIVVMDLDGSDLREISLPYGGDDLALQWAPSGTELALHYPVPGSARLHLRRVDLNGNLTRVIEGRENLYGEYWPQYSRDGEWIYFQGQEASTYRIWRVRPDGSDAGPVVPDAGTHETPSPSPDGNSIAYAHNRRIAIFDLTTGVSTVIPGTNGVAPRWSPTGEWIAFNDVYTLRMVRPDGSGLRTIVPNGLYETGFDWSPDGKFIVARNMFSGVELIEVESGHTLPLPFDFAAQIGHLTWTR